MAEAQLALTDWRLKPHEDEDGFRHTAVELFHDQDVIFELRAQLWVDPDAQPIEDASAEWPEDISPHQNVAILRMPKQDAYSAARQDFFDERMTFRPAHSLAAHQPL